MEKGKFKYYISDEKPIGNFLASDRRRIEVLLLIGYLLHTSEKQLSVGELTEILCRKYKFDVIEMNWEYQDFFKKKKYPYEIFFLTEELVPDVSENAFYCANIGDVMEHFANENSVKMLKSIKYFQKEG